MYCGWVCDQQLDAAFSSPVITTSHCGSVTGGNSCPGALTPGQIRAGAKLSIIDPTGALGAAQCIQDPNAVDCSFAAAAAIPIVGKGFKDGKLILHGVEGLEYLPRKLPAELDFPA